jgi:hypothetical protein
MSHEGDPSNKKLKNHQVTKACSTKLMIEGEGDAFQFKLQSCTKATHQTENERTINSPKLAPPN